MGIWAIVPVKPFRRGKSRLAGVLGAEERYALNQCLLEHTLVVLTAIEQVDHVLVISRDPQVLAMAGRYQARTLLENGTSNLNRSLEIATGMVRRRAHRGILALPADLPLLQRQDIENMLALSGRPPAVVIAPDRHGLGTNGLLVSPPGLFRFTFGPGSFARHSEAARLAGARLEIYHSPTIALDLDLPEDLALLRGKTLPPGMPACLPPEPAAKTPPVIERRTV